MYNNVTLQITTTVFALGNPGAISPSEGGLRLDVSTYVEKWCQIGGRTRCVTPRRFFSFSLILFLPFYNILDFIAHQSQIYVPTYSGTGIPTAKIRRSSLNLWAEERGFLNETRTTSNAALFPPFTRNIARHLKASRDKESHIHVAKSWRTTF